MAVTLGATALAACGSSDDDGEARSGPVSLTYWTWTPGMDKVVDIWNKGPGKKERITVTVKKQASGDDLVTKILTAHKAHKAPDLVQAEYQALPTLVSNDALADIGDEVGMLDADIIVQHTDSTAALQVAEERGLKGFGQSSDMIKFAPKAQMTSLVDDWGPYYISRVQALLDGKWTSTDTWAGIKDGAVQLAPFTNMPDDVKAMAEATTKKIADGWNPFTGPVAKQDGSEWLKDGQVAPDGELLGMNFYVKGVDDKLPQ